MGKELAFFSYSLMFTQETALPRELGSNSRSAGSTRHPCRQSWHGRGFNSFPWVRKLCKIGKMALREGNLGWSWGATEDLGEGKAIILWERLTQYDSHHSTFPMGIWNLDPRDDGPHSFSSYSNLPKAGLKDLLFMLQRLWGASYRRWLHDLHSKPRATAINLW